MFSDTLGWCWLEGWTFAFILLWGCDWPGGVVRDGLGLSERLLADLQMNESSDLF